MTKTIIADSSPLIVLLKSDLENILPKLFEKALVPEAVWAEILADGINDAATRKLPLLLWLEKISVKQMKRKISDYGLGKGETEALNLALQIPESGVILDDFAARKCAKDLNISFIGTGGLLISAKQKGLISSVSEALEKVQNEGLWLSNAIIRIIKEKAGE